MSTTLKTRLAKKWWNVNRALRNRQKMIRRYRKCIPAVLLPIRSQSIPRFQVSDGKSTRMVQSPSREQGGSLDLYDRLLAQTRQKRLQVDFLFRFLDRNANHHPLTCLDSSPLRRSIWQFRMLSLSGHGYQNTVLRAQGKTNMKLRHHHFVTKEYGRR